MSFVSRKKLICQVSSAKTVLKKKKKKSIFYNRSSFDSLSLDYFTRAGITNSIEKNAVNAFVVSIKANANIWASLQGGFVYLISPTSYGASLINLLGSSFTPSVGNTPNYSTTGWKFNGVNNYLKTGFNPSTSMNLNTGLLAISCNTNSTTSGISIGAADASNNQWNTVLWNTDNTTKFRAFDGATQVSGANTNSSGTFVCSCLSSTSRFIRRNGANVATSAATLGGSLVNLELYIGCRNLSGSASNFVPYEFDTIIQGLIGLSTSDADLLRTYIDTYNANVITGGR